MFTGIIEEVGSIDRIQNGAYSAVLLIKAKEILNIETDIIGKYIEKFINNPKKENGISKEFLIENGF